jgi:hypothetical protein
VIDICQLCEQALENLKSAKTPDEVDALFYDQELRAALVRILEADKDKEQKLHVQPKEFFRRFLSEDLLADVYWPSIW